VTGPDMSAFTKPNTRGSHASRILTLSLHTFTQLVRMKVFYFLAPFALIPIAANFFEVQQLEGPASMGLNALRSIKNWALGPIFIFANVIAVVATALLLPKDVEDRTLYTILAKPVPRLDYLVGKLLGVVALLFVSLLVMDLLMVGVLHIRTQMVIEEQMAMAESLGFTEAARESLRQETLSLGPSWALQGAVLSIFLKAMVMASFAMLVSTFSTSTLFTTVVSFTVFAIGHFQAYAREFYLQAGEAGQTLFSKLAALLFTLIIPDFQLFNVSDGLIENPVLPTMILVKLVGVAGYYSLFFLLAAWWVFSDKEI
jgi:ABC-2 type transport system permease protein